MTQSILVASISVGGCAPTAPPVNPPGFENATDPTNGGADFVGAAACAACHIDFAAKHNLHPHANTLKVVDGRAPQFPQALGSIAPTMPPANSEWTDVAYWVGGVAAGARIINREGFILTDESGTVERNWNVGATVNGAPAGYGTTQIDGAIPFDYSCFRCHVTGGRDESAFQDSRPGAAGTWVEAGVQCETCHGPGSAHFSAPLAAAVIDTTRIFVDPDGTESCRNCHQTNQKLTAVDGFIAPYQQWTELRTSGGHSTFACTVCHDPHVGLKADRTRAIRNECVACHADVSMAGHNDAEFVRDDFRERLTCESCHMPYATKVLTAADESVAGEFGRIGDVRTHVFRIDVRPGDFRAMLSSDESTVALDNMNRAAITVDFVCLRCHNGRGNVFELSVDRAAEIAARIHELP